MPISFILSPLAFIYVAIGMVECATAGRCAVAPFSEVAAPINPFLLPVAVTHPVEPLALVDGSTV